MAVSSPVAPGRGDGNAVRAEQTTRNISRTGGVVGFIILTGESRRKPDPIELVGDLALGRIRDLNQLPGTQKK